jgi:hypothetical protein
MPIQPRRYALNGTDRDRYAANVPDSVVEALLAAARSVLPGLLARHLALEAADPSLPRFGNRRVLIAKPKVPWGRTHALVTEAFGAFDPRLGDAARRVLADESRFVLSDVAPGGGGGFFNGWVAETKRRPGPIVFARDGTINDPVYLAHELGHLLASDAALREAPPDGMPLLQYHLAETQAFFCQMIVYDYLFRHGDPALRRGAVEHYVGEIVRTAYDLPRYASAALSREGGPPGAIVRFLAEHLGPRWPIVAVDIPSRLANDPAGADELLAGLHRHPSGLLLAAGLFGDVLAVEGRERDRVVDMLLLEADSSTGIADVLTAIGANTSDGLKAFADRAFAALVETLDAGITDLAAPCRPSRRRCQTPARRHP